MGWINDAIETPTPKTFGESEAARYRRRGPEVRTAPEASWWAGQLTVRFRGAEVTVLGDGPEKVTIEWSEGGRKLSWARWKPLAQAVGVFDRAAKKSRRTREDIEAIVGAVADALREKGWA